MGKVDELMALARDTYGIGALGVHHQLEAELRASLSACVAEWRLIGEADKVEWQSRITGAWTSGEWLTYGMSFWNPDDPGYWWDNLRAVRIRHQPTHILDTPEYPPIPTPPTTETEGETK